MNDISFVKGQGGLGRALPGEDYISGMLFYSAAYPSGFNSSNQIKQVLSLSQAEALGIVDTYTDETAAEAEYQITTKGSTGDTLKATVTEPTANGGTSVVDLGTYTVASADSTIALQGAAWEAIINAGTNTHGYSASFDGTDTMTITARKGRGISLNSGSPLGITITGDFAGALTQFTGGVASKLVVMHYHLQRYFKQNPKGNVYVGVFPVPGTYTFSELQDMQVYANGKIRKTLVYNDVARTTSQVASDTTAIQSICDDLEALHMPMSTVIYAPNIKAISDLSTLLDGNSYENTNVSVNIAQDGGGTGAELFVTCGKSITNAGDELGCLSVAAVNESIMWVSKFNVSDGAENETIAFSNGTLYTSVSQSLLDQLDNYRYTFLRKYVGKAGSYWNDSKTFVSGTSDYAFIENNQTIDKATRNVYAGLLPDLGSPLTLNSDGTLTDATIAALEADAKPGLDQMVRDGELSGYSIVIDPAQNVQSTGKLAVTINLLGVGVARNIKVTIGYVISL